MDSSSVSFKKFIFKSINSEEEIIIPQALNSSYGLYLWPCAVVLAQFIWVNKEQFVGTRVLEIGAGTSLPGIVAAKCGSNVTLSDSERFKDCLEISKISVEKNNLNIPVIGLTWGEFSPALIDLDPFDYVLGSDCLYDPAVFEDILVTISFLLDKNPNCKFICSYQDRSSDWSIENLLKKWHLSCSFIPLTSFDADTDNIAESGFPGSHIIHLFQITRK